jgi:23S rRNA-/tRNA-specific pseudouridylate synthase
MLGFKSTVFATSFLHFHPAASYLSNQAVHLSRLSLRTVIPQPFLLLQHTLRRKYHQQSKSGHLATEKVAANYAESFAINQNQCSEIDSDDDEAYTSDNDAVYSSGTSDGLIVTKIYFTSLEGFNEETTMPLIPTLFTAEDQARLELTSTNVTLPAALMLLDPITYPTQSRARKAIRKRSICFMRYNNQTTSDLRDPTKMKFQMGKVLSRIYPGDVVGFQRRIGDDYYATQGVPYRAPPFEVPVVYEDDHMAIVNKPPGVVLYRAEGGRGGGAKWNGHGRDTLLSALPYVLIPSNIKDPALINDGHVPLKRPHAVHRLDRPTSGLVVVAKTKFAAVHLARQFEFREVKKTYMAIVNGHPVMSESHQAESENENTINAWNTIDFELEGKSAVTDWRIVKSFRSIHGQGGVLTLVEMKPKTGRYHQLRRHFVSTPDV